MMDSDADGRGLRSGGPDPLVREMEAVLGRRVDDLERENRQLRSRTTVLTVGMAAALTLALGTLIYAVTANRRVADVVHARQFVLHDTDGAVRAGLGLTPEGGSRLMMKDREGRERLRLTLLADGSPGASFVDPDGRSRIVLGLLPDETANLVFADRVGRTRAVFGLMPDESSTLVFADRNGETRVGLGIDPRGGAGLTIFERDNGNVSPAAVASPADSLAADTLNGPAQDPPSPL